MLNCILNIQLFGIVMNWSVESGRVSVLLVEQQVRSSQKFGGLQKMTVDHLWVS